MSYRRSSNPPLNDSVTPSFPVESEKGKKRSVLDLIDPVVDEYVKKRVMPIFLEALPKEMTKKHRSVGGGVVSDQDFVLYQPHNYRLYFDYSRVNFIPPNKYQTDVKRSVVVTYKLKNSSEHFFEGFLGCNICVKKNQIEIINKLDHKKWYRVNSANSEKEIKDIIIRKDVECLTALKRFCRVFGGKSKLHILNCHSEDKIMLEDSIDKLPIKMEFHSDIVKKVYKEANVEFKDPAFAVNYLHNRSLEKVSPEIAERLDFIKNEIVVNKTNVKTDVERSVVTTEQILDILRIIAEQNKEISMGLNSVVKVLQLQNTKIEDNIPLDKPDYFG